MTYSRKLPFGLRMARIGWARSIEPIKVGACLVDGGLIIIGSNERKSSPVLLKYGYNYTDSIHAETSVLARLDSQPRSMVYTYRETKDGELANALPCHACMKLLQERGVRKVTYTVKGSFSTEWIQ